MGYWIPVRTSEKHCKNLISLVKVYTHIFWHVIIVSYIGYMVASWKLVGGLGKKIWGGDMYHWLWEGVDAPGNRFNEKSQSTQ